MVYRQFLRSAERHLQICKQLLKDVDALEDSTKKANVLSEIYYLSGYVLEAGLSYAFFSHIRYSGDIYLSEHYQNNGFKTHNISLKYSYLLKNSCIINDLVFVSAKHSNRELQSLFNGWDVKYRYEQYVKIKKRTIDAYIVEVERGLNKIRTQYPF